MMNENNASVWLENLALSVFVEPRASSEEIRLKLGPRGAVPANPAR